MFTSCRWLAAALSAVWLAAAAMADEGPPAPPAPIVRPGPAESDSAWLDLSHVLRLTLARNPSIAVARATWQEARARAREAAALEPPMLDVAVGPSSFGAASADPAWRVGVSQPLPLFGQRGLRARAARSELRAAGLDLRGAQLDLLHDARTAYFEYWRIARAIELANELRGLVSEFRQGALARYSAGLVGQQDPLRADAELAMLDHRLDVLARERLLVAARLDVLMHAAPDAPLPVPPRELPLPDTTMVHADLRAHALETRPELEAANAMVDAERANLALARRSAWPEPSLGVAYDRFMTEAPMRTSVSLDFALPGLSGRLAAERALASARLAGSLARRDVVRDSVALQVEEAATRLHELAHDLSISRDRLVPLAERTVRAARAGYEASRGDFLGLIQSERDLLQARLDADETFAMLNEARADLDRALGEDAELPGAEAIR
jgi:outer membrane protein, heavy metal efflux system